MDAVTEGNDALTRNGPYVMVFNPEFKSVRMLSPAGNKVLEFANRDALAEHLAEVQIAVSEQYGEEPTTRRYLVSELDGVSVAVPFVRGDENASLEPVADAPRLLVGFPLIGTEDFSFPAVVHSSRFTPTEDRDGVFLGQSDNDANLDNEAVLQEACRLILTTLAFAAKSGWANAWVLARVPGVHMVRRRLAEKPAKDALGQSDPCHPRSGDPLRPCNYSGQSDATHRRHARGHGSPRGIRRGYRGARRHASQRFGGVRLARRGQELGGHLPVHSE